MRETPQRISRIARDFSDLSWPAVFVVVGGRSYAKCEFGEEHFQFETPYGISRAFWEKSSDFGPQTVI
jgi:hypothetical protein